MPLPLIIGAAALVAASYGAKKGYDGYQKHSEADDLIDQAKSRYDPQLAAFQKQEKTTNDRLETLGRFELEIGQSFEQFKTLAQQLIEQIGAANHQDLHINIPSQQLAKVESYAYSAVGVLGSMAGASAAGVATGFAVYGGVMSLGAASTGTAISALSGIAAQNAALAALGGGALSAGGMGIAGGTAVLGAAVAAPVLAIAGWAYNSHGEKSLENAQKAAKESDAAVAKLRHAENTLFKTDINAERVHESLRSIYMQFTRYFYDLKRLSAYIEDIQTRNVDVQERMQHLGNETLLIVQNGYALAAILTDIITTPMFKVQRANGQPVQNAEGLPVMEKDGYDYPIANTDALDECLSSSHRAASKF